MRQLDVGAVTAGPSNAWKHVLGDEERLTAPHYAGARRFRAGRALLMVDLYNRAFGPSPKPLEEAILDEPSSCGLAGWQALPATRSLLDAARSAGVVVVYTVGFEGYPRTGPGAGFTGAVYRDPVGATSEKSAWANSVHDELAPLESELVIHKSRASAFHGTGLDSYLRALGVNALVVCGESTSGCIRATVNDGFSLGFDVMVPHEAVFDRSPVSHAVNLFDMNLKYATVTGQDVALNVLQDPAEVELIVSSDDDPVRGDPSERT